MIIAVPPDSLVHRIGGASVKALTLSARDCSADPPGLSVLLYESALDASRRMLREFGELKKWRRFGRIVCTTTAAEIYASGYGVIEFPTHSLPNHGRIIHGDGIAGFTEENLRRLSALFTTTEISE